MQAQQRAENGIQEKIVGYIGRGLCEVEAQELDENDLSAFAETGNLWEGRIDDLPESVRDILLAEQHRKTTGELLSIENFKKRRKEEQ